MTDAPLKRNIRELFPYSPGLIYSVDTFDKPISFFFFGCWNKNTAMTQLIIDDAKVNKNILFGIVNGDNFYPTVIKRDGRTVSKVHDQNNVTIGFRILKSFGKHIFLALGNHEVDNNDKCLTLLNEIRECKESNLMLPTNYYCLNINNDNGHKLKILIIDTNLLEENLCYDDDSRAEYREFMMAWLRIQLLDSDAPILIVGHYPLFYFKKGSFTTNETMIKIYELLISLSPQKIYYLASDVHNHQHIEHKNIVQYIVGNGGADLDTIDGSALGEHTNEYGIHRILDAQLCYGYSVFEYDGTNIGHIFKCVG